MSNSVVKVTDEVLNESLLLLVGEDGTVTPDKDTVQTILSSKTGPTNVQIMHINKSDAKGIDVSIDDLTYLPDAEMNDQPVASEQEMDEVARNLYNFRLDHDYTPLTSPGESMETTPEEDELAKTLSILDGGGVVESESVPVQATPVVKTQAPKLTAKVIKTTPAIIKAVVPPKLNVTAAKPATPKTATETILTPPASEASEATTSTQKPKPKIINAKVAARLKYNRPKQQIVIEDSDEEEEEGGDDEDFDIDDDDDDEEDDDENDSDFDIETFKPKRVSKRTRSESKASAPIQKTTTIAKPKVEQPKPVEVKPEVKPPEKLQVQPDVTKPVEVKPVESALDKKTPVKKEKKPPKVIPDDFALFSTPDIIRRVGGKEPTIPEVTPSSPTKPARISQENRSKSATENTQTPAKQNRLSIDGKVSLEKTLKPPENKTKIRRTSVDVKSKRNSTDEKQLIKTEKKAKSTDDANSEQQQQQQLDVSDSSVVLPSEPTAVFGGSLDQNNIHLDAAGLDLDPTLLDNINNDMISEDILYQVAQSLVSNTDIQSAIEKGINEGNLVLDPSLQVDPNLPALQEQNSSTTSSEALAPKPGTQIVRPDGRIVVIPPIERPTTRSRNKKKDEEKPVFKPIHKPLDDDHVSGNELDSSNDEEESEDDPNKLWCICNQPHNNRFMICCDTCEEWYHGKCVNITKTMGQQMESEGKEWICLFCKDPSLRRPQAAARRVRKASRNSRASTDSAGSSKKTDNGAVPCVVCQKPSRKNSIFCSETCILAHAQGVERVVVFERASGRMLTGNKAPSAANLDQWLKSHPGYEVVRSQGKIVTSKPQAMTQSKLKLVKNTENEGVSLAIQKKGINVGVLKHSLKNSMKSGNKNPLKAHVTSFKIITKEVSSKEVKTKLIQAQPMQQPPVKNSPSQLQPTPKPKTVQTTLTKTVKNTTPNKDKPVPVKTPKARQAEQATPPSKQQENIRENVQKTLFEQLTNRLKIVEDLKLTEDEVKNISTEIESQLYKCFGDTGQKYRNKYRSLIFNIKDVKNQTLWRRICEKSINPYELVRLSPDDLASQELAMWREREAKHQLDMIKKSELELLNCNRQYVLKTHKGEQVLEDSRPTDNIDNTEVIKSLTEGGNSLDSGSDSKHDSSSSKEKKASSSSKHNHKDKERDRERKSSKDKDRERSRDKDKERDRSRRRSRSKEHSKHGDKKRSRSRDRDRHRKSSHKSSRHKKDNLHISTTDKLDKKSKEILEQLVDNKIVPPLEDRLWKHVPQEDIIPPAAESDSDHEPTSTVTIPTPPRNPDSDDFQGTQSQSSNESKSDVAAVKEKDNEEKKSTSPPPKTISPEIWRGTMNMIDVAQISITAHEVSGDCSGLGRDLPSNLDIVGRILPETVWDYIGKMKCSNSKMISLLRLSATNQEEKMPYLALYSYLSSRNRLGVVKSNNKAVKDFYILPLASQKPIPQALLPLSGPGFEESRPPLLLGIIVRDKRKRPYSETSIGPQKRVKVEIDTSSSAPVVTARSYTPPPIKDPRLNKLPLPPTLPLGKDDDEEPYSPEDSDPDSIPTPLDMPSSFLDTSAPTSDTLIPGLSTPPLLPSSTLEIQRQMEELNKKIEMQKSEINSISQNIATASTEIGTSALANIALPSNLQQILDSIKTIGAVTTESETKPIEASPIQSTSQTDLTIPLMIPKSFTRPLSSTSAKSSVASDTIPLKLPTKPKIKVAATPSKEAEKSNSVLSSLSEEDLIRKAAEMLGEVGDSTPIKKTKEVDVEASSMSPDTKRAKVDVELPPVPGLD